MENEKRPSFDFEEARKEAAKSAPKVAANKEETKKAEPVKDAETPLLKNLKKENEVLKKENEGLKKKLSEKVKAPKVQSRGIQM